MMALTETQIQSVNLFFILAFLDEALARTASVRFVVAHRKAPPIEESYDSFFVRKTARLWEKLQAKGKSSGIVHERHWDKAPRLDFASWRQFRKEAPPEEFLTWIWCEALKISQEEVAKGLSITVGTVRHRLNEGSRRLAQTLSLGEPRGQA